MKKTFVMDFFGNATRAAEALGISQPAVWRWGDDIPDSAVGRIARLYPELMEKWIRENKGTVERRSGMPRRHSLGRRSADG